MKNNLTLNMAWLAARYLVLAGCIVMQSSSAIAQTPVAEGAGEIVVTEAAVVAEDPNRTAKPNELP